MSFLFGGAGTAQPKQRVDPTRECRRALHRGIRSMQLELKALTAAETKERASMRSSAEKGDMEATRNFAMQLAATKKRIERNNGMQKRMATIDHKLSDVGSCNNMTEAMRAATLAMQSIGGSADMATMAKMVGDFERESEALEDKKEIMDEAIDTMCGDDEKQEGDVSEAVGQILAEIGLDINTMLATPPHSLHILERSDHADIERRLMDLKTPNA